MTLCKPALKHLSAVGRVYVGPVAGWFVEAHGWANFYLFSVFAAVPGIVLLLVCRKTLEYSQQTKAFMPRAHYAGAYRLALKVLLASLVILLLWLLVLIANALQVTDWAIEIVLLEVGMLLALCGILMGALLDFMALKKTP